MTFAGHYAYVSGWGGITVLDIAQADDPQVVGALPLPHFENEDVDLCGDTLLVVNDRAELDLGAVMYVVSIANRDDAGGQRRPPARAHRQRARRRPHRELRQGRLLPGLGRRRQPRRGRRPHRPERAALARQVPSVASESDFDITHDSELDSTGTVWSVGGGGAAGYRLTANPLAPQLLGSTGEAGRNPSPYNDFILHNSQRHGKTLLITEEDYIDTSEVPPGGCRGQGKFETWDLSRLGKGGAITPLATWETELNGMFTSGAVDSKAPVTVNCSSHWFDAKDGIAAVGWYEQGVRFLDYRSPTEIVQVGYYIPANGSTWAAYWSPTDPNGEIVYTADAYRGVDVLRIDGGGLTGKKVKAPVRDEWIGGTATDARRSCRTRRSASCARC